MVRKWKADAMVAALMEKERAMQKERVKVQERAKVQEDKSSQERLASLRSSPKKQKVGDGGNGKSAQGDSVPSETSQVPSVEKVMQFDDVRRVGTELSGIPLDPADVERECENLSDDEEGVEVERESSVVVID